MAKNIQALKTAFPIAAVWFGALVGPSMVSGAFAAVYFAPYELWGLLLPFVAMGVASIIVICGLFGVKAWHVDNYADYGKKLYGPLAKYLSPLLEVYLILAMLVGGSAVIVMGGSFFHDWLHLSPLIGEILMALLSTVLVLWGVELLRRASALMTLILLAGFVLMVGLSCTVGQPALIAIWANRSNLSLQTLLAGLGPAVALGLSNACNALTLSSVAQNLRTNREVWLAGGCAFFMNSLVFIGCVLFLLPFLPEVLQADMPNPYIIQHYLARPYPWLIGVYNLIMLLGLVSSGAPQLNAVIYRVDSLYPCKNIFRRPFCRNLCTAILYMIACILIARLGLRTIIGQGYTLLGYLALPLIVIPLCIVLPLRLRREK